MKKTGKKKKALGVRKDTINKYSKVIVELKKVTKPTKIDKAAFGKKHNVSANLTMLLVNEGYMIKTKAGIRWCAKYNKTSDKTIARVIAKKLYDAIHPFNQKRSKMKKKTTNIIKPKATKALKVNKANGNDRIDLAKQFALLGDYSFAKQLLDS